MTTAMVDVERMPARSAKGFVGMNERISCGSVRSLTCPCWEASDDSSAASGVAPSRKPAFVSPVSTVAPQPTMAAMVTVPSSTANAAAAMRPKCSVTSARVNAPRMATNTSGMTSILSRPM